jgi:diguanylate cyclase (GGDEF)-like protein
LFQTVDKLGVALLSIRKYLTGCGTGSTGPDSHLQVCLLLLDGISRYAFAYDREEYTRFRERIKGYSEALEMAKQAAPMWGIVGETVSAMKDYTRGAQHVVGGQAVELRCMIEMLSQTLLSLADAGGKSVEALQTLRNQVETASRLDDIRAVRTRLGDSLKILSDETKRQKERNTQMQREAIEAARMASGRHTEADPDADTVTGYTSRQRAEAEIATRLDASPPSYAAVIVLERLDAINLRYGFAAGDAVLRSFARQLANGITPPDMLFRWRGPAFVGLLSRTVKQDAVQAEVRNLAGKQSIQVADLPLRVTMTCASAVLCLEKCGSAVDVYHQIDRFVAEYGVAAAKE